MSDAPMNKQSNGYNKDHSRRRYFNHNGNYRNNRNNNRNNNNQQRFEHKPAAAPVLETAEDIANETLRIEKEIAFEINEIKSIDITW